MMQHCLQRASSTVTYLGEASWVLLESALALMSSAVCCLSIFSSAASSVLASGLAGFSRLCLIRRTSALAATTLVMQLLLASLLLASDRSGVRPNELDLPAGIRGLDLIVSLSESRERLRLLATEPLILAALRPPLTPRSSEAPASACSSADEECSVPSAVRAAEADRACDSARHRITKL